MKFYNEKLPDYYPTMYLDGFQPFEILTAFRRCMLQEIEERKEDEAFVFYDGITPAEAAKKE